MVVFLWLILAALIVLCAVLYFLFVDSNERGRAKDVQIVALKSELSVAQQQRDTARATGR